MKHYFLLVWNFFFSKYAKLVWLLRGDYKQGQAFLKQHLDEKEKATQEELLAKGIDPSKAVKITPIKIASAKHSSDEKYLKEIK